jgi:hypothetical protein
VEVPELQGERKASLVYYQLVLIQVLISDIKIQRQHSATVLEAPKSYPQQEPAKAMNILTMDCRGLEFVDFKADVSV